MFLYEILGTAMLLVAINLGADSEAKFSLQPFAVVFVVLAGIINTGHVSGAHFNPAVTIGVLINTGITYANILFAVQIIIAELIGASLGVLFVYSVLDK